MTLVQAAILGIVQGLTEFLPISSSGHLALAERFFQLSSTSLHFEVAVHFATLLAVIVFFFQDILKLRIRDYVVLAIGTVPAVIVGLFFQDIVEQAFSSLWQIAIDFMITGVVLILTQRILDRSTDKKTETVVSAKKSFLIGIAQAIAIFPAISRSGSTVAAALNLRIERQTAFRFSFLLSIPAILGASTLTIVDILQQGGGTVEEPLSYFVIGGVFAFGFGIFSLRWFKKIIASAQLKYFGYYCCGLSIILIAQQLFHIL